MSIIKIVAIVLPCLFLYFVMGTLFTHLMDRRIQAKVEREGKKPLEEIPPKDGAIMSLMWPVMLVVLICVWCWEGIVWLGENTYRVMHAFYSRVLP